MTIGGKIKGYPAFILAYSWLLNEFGVALGSGATMNETACKMKFKKMAGEVLGFAVARSFKDLLLYRKYKF